MPGNYTAPLVVSLLFFIWSRFLLEPTGWFFYELHHATGVDAVYWGYTAFRGAGYLLGTSSLYTPGCLLLSGALFALLAWRRTRKLKRSA